MKKYQQRAATREPRGPNGFTLTELLGLLIAGRRTVALCLVLTVALAILYTVVSKRVYEATASILIEQKGKEGASLLANLPDWGGAGKITNKLEALKSTSLVAAVADSLLRKQYLDSVHSERIPIVASAVERAGEYPLRDILIQAIQNVIDLTSVKESDVIKVTAKSINPREAALLANVYAGVFVERNVFDSRLHTRTIREFLQGQMVEKQNALQSAETQLQDYMNTSGMVSLDLEAKKVVDQLSQLEANRDAMDIDISSRTKTLTSYKQELATLEPNVARAIGESNDSYIRLLQEQLAKLEVQRDVVIAQNPELKGERIYSDKLLEIDSQIAALQKNLKQRTKSYLASVLPGDRITAAGDATTGFLGQVKQKIVEQQIELDGLVARRAALQSVIVDYERQFNQIPRKSMQLARLQRTQLSDEKLYLLVQEKFNEAAITESSELGDVVIMDPAMVPMRPVRPIVLMNIALGILFGLGLGVAVVIIRAALDVRVSSSDDLKRRGYPVLCTIGKMELDRKTLRKGSIVRAGGTEVDAHLIALHNPLSPYAESYRHLRTSLKHALGEKKTKVFVVTSANPGEGKSTTVANLAIAFAEGEHRTLLIDADMRRPALHTMFGIKKDKGLADYLLHRANMEDTVHRAVVANLDLICSGAQPPNPAAIVGSARMEQLIASMGAIYDVLLFDTPPLHAVSDAAILSTMVDGAVVVVSAGSTTLPTLEDGIDNLLSLGGTLLGVALNNFDLKHALRVAYGSKGYGYYGYGYGSTTSSGASEQKPQAARR